MTPSDGRDAELLACPFCGSAAENGNGFLPAESIVYAWCSNVDCQLHPMELGFSPEDWNTRSVTLPSPDNPSREELAVIAQDKMIGLSLDCENGEIIGTGPVSYAIADAIVARLRTGEVRSLQQRIHMLRVTLSSVVTLANGGRTTLRNLSAIGKAAKHSLDRDAALSPPSPGERKDSG